MTAVPALDWLLEPDNPSARTLALTRLLGRPEEDPEVAAARAAIPGWGPARAILDAQWPEGYWMHPGVGYSPKFKATFWQIIFLGALGAPLTPAIEQACAYVVDNTRLPDGLFTGDRTPKGDVACLNGNLLRAMARLGYKDRRLAATTDALAGALVRDEFRCRCNARPRPARHRDGLPCAWGTIKALGAFAELPAGQRSAAVQSAIESGISFLLAGDLANGAYPGPGGPSELWHKLGFPPGYTADVLEGLEVLVRLGARDARLAPAIDLVRSKQGASGRWRLEHALPNTWAPFGRAGQFNKWVTLHAAWVMQEY